MRLLVTGGAGYIGGFVARLLLNGEHEVIVLDDLSTGHRHGVGRAALIEGDVGDKALLSRLLRSHRIDGILHFAALKSVVL